MSMSDRKVLYVTATLPALTVTFIYREIFRLRKIGVGIDCVSMNTPDEGDISKDAKSLVNDTEYLDGVGLLPKLAGFILAAIRHPIRLVRCFGIVLSASPMQGIRDYARLIYHLVEGAYLSRKLDMGSYRHIHAHFINGPTSIAMFLSEISGVPFSFTMHASMIWLDPIAFSNKLDRCAFCASISEYNKNYVSQQYGAHFAKKIHIVHCGIDPEPDSIGVKIREPGEPMNILGVGQLNARKGFHVLIESCGLLRDSGISFRCKIVGGGEQHSELERLVRRHNLEDLVTLTGPVKHEVVEQLLAECDLFVLPCIISKDGWRDGIPVALMEAMFHERAVISSRILGIPELIEDEVSGRLVEAEQPRELAAAITELAAEPEVCARLAVKGREKVLEEFNNSKSAATLAGLFSAP
jgi:glycosyltransferase involved in cell wall biosynthesis